MPKAIIIGAGFAGISAATHLANKGFEVLVLEKNKHLGGRARQWKKDGFTFDMGPSWYWMPDVFERYFAKFGKSVSDYYTLKRLNPSYRVVFGKDDAVDLPAELEDLCALFEAIEKGTGEKLREFLSEAAIKYQVGINDLVYKPGLSLTEYADMRVLKGLLNLHLLRSVSSHVRKFVSHQKLIDILEFPVLFLGATPQNTPALYTLMNYADMVLGTWYPDGGMYKVVDGMVQVAQEKGVDFIVNQEVTGFTFSDNTIVGVQTQTDEYFADVVVAAADYAHIDKNLLPNKFKNYTDKYWNSRKLAPSSLIFYLGLNKKLTNVLHHNLFFDKDFAVHAHEIYTEPSWPSAPLFYACVPSITDASVAPAGYENLFLLMPVAPELEDTEEKREKYYHQIMDRLELLTGQEIRSHVVVKRSYAHRDFKADYHSFKGNAYGLANTLSQTAILKPSIKNKKLKNLYFTGQLTVPGPGVPPSLISGEVVCNTILKDLKTIMR